MVHVYPLCTQPVGTDWQGQDALFRLNEQPIAAWPSSGISLRIRHIAIPDDALLDQTLIDVIQGFWPQPIQRAPYPVLHFALQHKFPVGSLPFQPANKNIGEYRVVGYACIGPEKLADRQLF